MYIIINESTQIYKQKTHTLQDEKPALPWDDRKPRISWRGDGQFFVVSTISPSTGNDIREVCH